MLTGVDIEGRGVDQSNVDLSTTVDRDVKRQRARHAYTDKEADILTHYTDKETKKQIYKEPKRVEERERTKKIGRQYMYTKYIMYIYVLVNFFKFGGLDR